MPALLAVAILANLPAASAWAQKGPPRGGGQQQGQGGQRDGGRGQDGRDQDRRSLSDSVRAAERDARGEVLSAERVQYDGRDMHRVKVVDDQGRVRVFMQDAERGDSSNPPSRGGNADRPPRKPPTRNDDD